VFLFPRPQMLPLLASPAPGPSLQRHRLPLLPAPPGIGGAAGVGGSGEGKEVGGGGMRASDIGGVDGPAATLTVRA
jgi:hypothetical protein